MTVMAMIGLIFEGNNRILCTRHVLPYLGDAPGWIHSGMGARSVNCTCSGMTTTSDLARLEGMPCPRNTANSKSL
jgi:hypothetical protein